IWDNITVTEQHSLTGYRNGPGNPIDSTWQTTVGYSGQRDTNIAGTLFERTARGLDYALPQPNYSYPLLQIIWDTVSQTAQVGFYKYSHTRISSYHYLDTLWYVNAQALPAPLPVDRDIEFMLPAFRYQIMEDSSDGTGLVNLQETTNASVTSGSFDIILKR
ncbi:MAG: hypothetical protein ACHQNE_07625, partial [Candidatus Kapaibacterium sp.]